jgi:hypothetical protein
MVMMMIARASVISRLARIFQIGNCALLKLFGFDGSIPNVNLLSAGRNVRPVTPEVAGSSPVSLAMKSIGYTKR